MCGPNLISSSWDISPKTTNDNQWYRWGEFRDTPKSTCWLVIWTKMSSCENLDHDHITTWNTEQLYHMEMFELLYPVSSVLSPRSVHPVHMHYQHSWVTHINIWHPAVTLHPSIPPMQAPLHAPAAWPPHDLSLSVKGVQIYCILNWKMIAEREWYGISVSKGVI